MLKGSQPCSKELADCREENLEARDDSERVELISAELLCNRKRHSSKHLFLRLQWKILLHFKRKSEYISQKDMSTDQ